MSCPGRNEVERSAGELRRMVSSALALDLAVLVPLSLAVSGPPVGNLAENLSAICDLVLIVAQSLLAFHHFDQVVQLADVQHVVVPSGQIGVQRRVVDVSKIVETP